MREKWGSSRVFLMQRRGWCYLKQICTIPMILRKQFEGVNMFFMWPPHCTMTPAALRSEVSLPNLLIPILFLARRIEFFSVRAASSQDIHFVEFNEGKNKTRKYEPYRRKHQDK